MSRESMDEMLQRVRDYVFQTDQALKESQRHICRDGAGQLETSALKEIRCSSCYVFASYLLTQFQVCYN
jgi:hypothetical protein